MSLRSLCEIHEATLERCEIDDADGTEVPSWPDSEVVKCRIVPATAKEIAEYAARGIRVSGMVYTVFDPEMSSGDRFVYLDKHYYFKGTVEPDLMQRFWKTAVLESNQIPTE